MQKSLPYLELRPTDFFWRRRLLVASLSCNPISFFCFQLKINVPREAAAVATRIGLPTLNKWENAYRDNDVVSTEGARAGAAVHTDLSQGEILLLL